MLAEQVASHETFVAHGVAVAVDHLAEQELGLDGARGVFVGINLLEILGTGGEEQKDGQ